MQKADRKGHAVGSSRSAAIGSSIGLPLSSSTDTSRSSSRDCPQYQRQQPPAAVGARPCSGNLKDFKERVDSTIQQLSGLVSLLSNRDALLYPSPQPQQQQQQQQKKKKQQPTNSSNAASQASEAENPQSCCCRCHAVDGCALAAPTPGGSSRRRTVKASSSTAVPPPQPPQSAARRVLGDVPDDVDLATASTNKVRRKASIVTMANGGCGGGGSGGPKDQRSQQPQPQQQPQQQLQPQPLQQTLQQPQQPQMQPQQSQQQQQQPEESSIRFLWYDTHRRRYSTRDAELVCAKAVKRLHLSVHYFRVGGEDLLLLEKDCSEDGLAFLDVDSVVAFEGLSVEKVLKLQRLGCQLRPEDLSREFAVEKGRSKYYVVPVEEADGDWRLCDDAGAQKLEAMKRLLEQQELRQGGAGSG